MIIHFIISNESYDTIEKIVFLNRLLGTIYLLTVPLILISLCICLSMYNEDEKKMIEVYYLTYATLDYLYKGIRIDSIDKSTQERRRIYFTPINENPPRIKWINSNNININGNKININNGYCYDKKK